ncbi:unnamed protein product [Linum trigynum]|uniref:Uncharacterized protein n=1 Tax=Linum trigynum TaxID=586398 RepID=A0AAV2CPQ3_9ROSI
MEEMLLGSGGRSMKGLLLGSGCRFFPRSPRNLIGIRRMEGRSIDEASLKRCGRLFPRSPRNLIGLRGVERRSIDGGDAAAELRISRWFSSSRRFSKRLRRMRGCSGRDAERAAAGRSMEVAGGDAAAERRLYGVAAELLAGMQQEEWRLYGAKV